MNEVEHRPEIPTLDTCAQEPIHLPGASQPHGALLVLEDGLLAGWSANAPQLLGGHFSLGRTWAELGLPALLTEGLAADLDDARSVPGAPLGHELAHGGQVLSRLTHHHEGRDIVEFEQHRAQGAPAPLARTRLFTMLRNELDTVKVLSQCVDQIRAWTGFDRVMAYVFQPDASGDVVAESRVDAIDSFLNMRFPASDIPDQARRLYILSTLRLIPDVDYAPVPLLGAAGARPVDLSFAVLRSVSPIHVEYLKNMGVGASMSVSIVVDGKLWGLFACHHRTPHHVAHEAREACDALAQFVSSRVQALQSHVQAVRAEEAATVIPALIGAVTGEDDLLRAIAAHAAPLERILRADGIVVAHQGKVVASNAVPHAIAVAMANQAPADAGLRAYDAREQWPPGLRDAIGEWVGALDIVFDAGANGRIIALRREQVSTVRWGGSPEKLMQVGPNGPRLTPRGSFAEWKQTVRGRSAAWMDPTRAVARQLQSELARVCMARHAEMEQTRRHLLAALGHDLRDPLHAIRMAASVLQRDDSSKAWGHRIDNSSGRMQRLIAQVLDFSRAEAGQPMLGEPEPFDLADVVDDLVDEARTGHPGVRFNLDVQRPAVWVGDRERTAQAMSNLLSNARHYGEPGRPIGVEVRVEGNVATVVVRNAAPPIDAAVIGNLADPFKQRGPRGHNRSGLGLGLFIAHRIASETGGGLSYRHQGGEVAFTLELRARASTGT